MPRGPKLYWTLLFLALILTFGFWGVRAGRALFVYTVCDAKVEPQEWECDLSDEGGKKWAVRVRYAYRFGGETFTGAAPWRPAPYPSLAAAKSALAACQKEKAVWVWARRPAVAILERAWPVKETFYSLCVLGLLVYFGTLRRRVRSG